jgi:hypothetical protein
VLNKEYTMSKKWDRIATREFEALDLNEQRDWIDLRAKIARRK